MFGVLMLDASILPIGVKTIRGRNYSGILGRCVTGRIKNRADEIVIEMIFETSVSILNKLIVFLGIGLMGLMANPIYAAFGLPKDHEDDERMLESLPSRDQPLAQYVVLLS